MSKQASSSKMMFIIQGVLFGFFMGVFEWMSNGLSTPFPFGSSFILGLFFGIGMAVASPFFTKKAKANIDVDGEKIILDGPANHLLNMESRGGHLVLTEKHLWFFSHGMNMQNSREKIDLAQIKHTEVASIMGIIPNAIKVILNSGAEHKFVVHGRNEWMDKLYNAKKSIAA